MFSDESVQKLAGEFVCYKVDPRDGERYRPVAGFKGTRYVPEVAFLSPSGEVVTRLEDRSVAGTVRTMKQVLAKAKK